MGLGLLVEPTLEHHVLAHHRHADNDPQHKPDLHVVRHGVPKDRSGHHAGAGHKRADMSHLGYQPVPDRGAAHQTDVITGHQQTDPYLVDALGRQAQAEVGTQQATANQHQQGGKI